MSSFLDLLAQADALIASHPDLPDGAKDLLDSVLLRLLNIEGPPATPIEGFSEEITNDTLIRSIKGRPDFMARSWITEPWRCLLIDRPSIPMGRPITLKPAEGETIGRTILESKSQHFQQRIVQACQQLRITVPVGEGAVHAVFGTHRTFIAWRMREQDEPMNRALRGDVDNFSKNILDGLQRAGILPNDRGVFHLTATKGIPSGWDQPTMPLEETIRKMALDQRAKGESYETIMADLRLSRAHMLRIFPDYKLPRAFRPKNPSQDHAKTKQALDRILAGEPYIKVRKETGAPGNLLREQVAQHLRPRILEGKTTVHDIARELRIDARTASGFFRHDPEAHKALKLAAEASRHVATPKDKDKTAKRLQEAIRDVENGTPITQAATKHKVNIHTLRSRLQRIKAKANK